MTFNPNAYLERIGLSDVPATPEGLNALQAAQINTIAFENIGPFLGTAPDLALSTIWSRTVEGTRGGWCLELNQLLGEALRSFGFKAQPVLGRVRMGAPVGSMRAHLAHIVELEGREWYVDAGFGGPAPLLPLSLESDLPQHGFRVRRDAVTGEHVVEKQTRQGWFALLGFDRVAVTPPDLVAANHFCASGPGSPFPNHLMINIGAGDRKASLFDQNLTVINGATTEIRPLQDTQDLSRVLASHFRLSPGADIVTKIWNKLNIAAMNDRIAI